MKFLLEVVEKFSKKHMNLEEIPMNNGIPEKTLRTIATHYIMPYGTPNF